MARRTVQVSLKDRDANIVFKVTEMSAIDLEDYTIRLGLALGSALGEHAGDMEGLFSRKDLPAVIAKAISKADYSKLKPLLEEMLARCAVYVPEPGVEMACTRDVMKDVVYDMRTVIKLRGEILKLNYSFLQEGQGSPSDFPGSGNTSEKSGRGVRVSVAS
jgi:hypothetical protein